MTIDEALKQSKEWYDENIRLAHKQRFDPYPKSLQCQKHDAVEACIKDLKRAMPDSVAKFMRAITHYVGHYEMALAWQHGYLPQNMIGHIKEAQDYGKELKK